MLAHRTALRLINTQSWLLKAPIATMMVVRLNHVRVKIDTKKLCCLMDCLNKQPDFHCTVFVIF